MNLRTLSGAIASIAGMALLAACGGSQVPSGAVGVLGHGHPAATPVPPLVATYSALVLPTLHATASDGQTLLSTMQSKSPGSLALICQAAGLTLSGQFDAFNGVSAPSQTRVPTATALAGYKLAMSATSECAMAADANSKSQMATAARDLWTGIRQVNSAASTIAAWAKH